MKINTPVVQKSKKTHRAGLTEEVKIGFVA